MKIIFFGADPWFSPPVVEAVLRAGHQIPVIVTKGDALGEGRRKKEEGRRNIKIIQAKESQDISLNSLMHAFSLRPSAFSLSKPDAIILAAFGPPFLGSDVLGWPKYGCLNVHASLLPRWRGASPVFACLREGDKETGVSIMRMTEKIDRGPIIGQSSLEIRQPGIIRPGLPSEGRAFPNHDTRETLTKKLGLLGGELIVSTLKKLEKGQITEVNQPEKSPTPYTRRLTKDSGRIGWSRSPIEIERFIRAAFPWPSAMSNVKFKMKNSKWQTIQNVKILKAHLERSSQRDCRGRLRRPRNDATLVIDLLQLPGKNPVTWKQFLAGHPNITLVHGPKKSKSRR